MVKDIYSVTSLVVKEFTERRITFEQYKFITTYVIFDYKCSDELLYDSVKTILECLIELNG